MKEADTQLRDWIEYKKTTRQSKQVEVLPTQASEPTEVNNEEDRIIFTDYQAIQKELEEKAKEKTFANKTPDYHEKTPAEKIKDTIDAQYAHMIRQWENKIEATLVGDPREFFAQWLENASLVREYIDEFGKLPAQRDNYKDVNIGTWLNSQKQNYKNNNLSQEHIDILLDIDKDIFKSQEEIDNERWLENAELLREYVNENNELPKRTTIYKDVKIGSWLNVQKQNYKNKKLSQERIDILLDIHPDTLPIGEETTPASQIERLICSTKNEHLNANI
jgi:hypothetical protein